VSQLLTQRPLDQVPEGYIGWTFMTLFNWGEVCVLVCLYPLHETRPSSSVSFLCLLHGSLLVLLMMSFLNGMDVDSRSRRLAIGRCELLMRKGVGAWARSSRGS
jgi:hypothetical protein